MQGIITDIQRFSVHDGPGIRTTVFLKGCNLRCAWCHNPETLHPGPELQVLPDKCIDCKACLEACPQGAHEVTGGRRVFHRDRCTACGACAAACYSGALVLVGRRMAADEVMAEVLEDRVFYETSGGGVTVSGGEPLSQREFARGILDRAKQEHLHTAVDTNLASPWQDVAALLPVADLFLVDVKMMDSARHTRWTGAPNALVLENARRLSREGVRMVVRTPVVPGVNDTVEQIGAVADFIRAFPNLEYYELLPYHPLGTGKYRSLGMDYAMEGLTPPKPDTMQALAEAAGERGIAVRVAGAATVEKA